MDFKAARKEADRLEAYSELLRYQAADQKSHAVRIRAGIEAYKDSMRDLGFSIGKEPTGKQRLRILWWRFSRLFRSDKSSEGVAA